MSANTLIEWTHHTFNPWWGCTKVSEACKSCYAATIDKRLGRGLHWGNGRGRRLASESYWKLPLAWDRKAARAGKRVRVFCLSMGDIFDPEVPRDVRARLFRLIRQTQALDWLLLTKRPELAREFLPADWGAGYANVWLGATVENEARAAERIPLLVAIQAVVRFLSIEPQLDAMRDLPLDGVDWVIAGGESAARARSTHADWFRSVRDQCVERGVPFFFKQWGSYGPSPAGDLVRLGKKNAGRVLDGRTWDELPTPDYSRCTGAR